MKTLSTFALIALAVLATLAGEAEAKKRSAKDQALYDKARKECNGPMYPNGARILINYSGGWYRCESPSDRRR
jgi:hypothetical protein